MARKWGGDGLNACILDLMSFIHLFTCESCVTKESGLEEPKFNRSQKLNVLIKAHVDTEIKLIQQIFAREA